METGSKTSGADWYTRLNPRQKQAIHKLIRRALELAAEKEAATPQEDAMRKDTTELDGR